MRLKRAILPLLFSAIAALFCAAGLYGNASPPVHASAENVHALLKSSFAADAPACLLTETHGLSPRPTDDGAVGAFQGKNSPQGAVTARIETRLLTGLHGMGQKKKSASALGEKLFEPYPPPRQVMRFSCFGPLLPAKSNAYEKFPFDPRSPCSSFLG
ncbi:exported hypothetical protein [uncultured delta proteobacterium]|uniref:Uncharacterized protein n=1 Tax=uncultured delta proteobacterium TaxID=34034 RepID=A0A212KFP3_9DELT|nr:exported hypothetical protein [uncultured delta proteobacterium]